MRLVPNIIKKAELEQLQRIEKEYSKSTTIKGLADSCIADLTQTLVKRAMKGDNTDYYEEGVIRGAILVHELYKNLGEFARMEIENRKEASGDTDDLTGQE